MKKINLLLISFLIIQTIGCGSKNDSSSQDSSQNTNQSQSTPAPSSSTSKPTPSPVPAPLPIDSNLISKQNCRYVIHDAKTPITSNFDVQYLKNNSQAYDNVFSDQTHIQISNNLDSKTMTLFDSDTNLTASLETNIKSQNEYLFDNTTSKLLKTLACENGSAKTLTSIKVEANCLISLTVKGITSNSSVKLNITSGTGLKESVFVGKPIKIFYETTTDNDDLAIKITDGFDVDYFSAITNINNPYINVNFELPSIQTNVQMKCTLSSNNI